jgi:hypothetical protein
MRLPSLLRALTIATVSIASLAAVQSQQSTGIITGVVVDSLTSVPLAGATVRIDGAELAVHSGGDGAFRVDGVSSGSQWLDVSLAGYGRARPRVEVRGGGVVHVTIPLVAGATAYLETVDVRPGANPTDTAAPAARTLDSSDLERLRSVLADDPFRALHTLPGVTASDDFRSEFSVRGSDSRHLGMSMDGIAIPWPLHAVRGLSDTGSIAVINSDAVDRLRLDSGSYAQQSGMRTGGWIDFSLRDGSRNEVRTRAAASVTNASMLAEGPLAGGRGSWLVSARRSYLNWLLHRIDADTDAAALGFLDQQGRVVLDLSSSHQLQISAIAGLAGYDEHDDTPGVNSLREAESQTAVVTAGLRSIAGGSTVLQRVGYVWQGFHNTSEYSQDLGDGGLKEWLYNATVARRVSSRLLLEGSAEIRHQEQQRTLRLFAREGTGIIVVAEDSLTGHAWLPSGHAQLTWQPTPSMMLSPGLRIAYSTLAGHAIAAPWLQAMWRNGRADVKLGAGVYPQFAEFDQVLGPTGAARLDPERATHADLAVGARLGGLRWEAAAYYRGERDMLRLDDEARASGSRIVTPVGARFRNALNGSVRGIELTVEGDRRKIAGWITYAYSRARHTDRNTGETFWSDFDQRHTLNMVARYRLSDTTGFGVKWRYGTNVPVAGYYRERDGSWFLTDSRNVSRFPSYSRADIRADRVFTLGGTRMTLFAEVVNLFDHTNLGPADPAIRARTLEAVRVTETLLPRVPAIGVMIDF